MYLSYPIETCGLTFDLSWQLPHVLREFGQANMMTETLCPLERLRFSAEVLTDAQLNCVRGHSIIKLFSFGGIKHCKSPGNVEDFPLNV